MAFRGDLSGITSKNKPNATYQSMIDGELLYEYAIHRYTTNKTRATFRCAGCRSAIDDRRAPPEFKIYYLKGAVDLESLLQKSSFSNGSNIVRINDDDFVFLMEDKGIEILRKAKYWKFHGTFEKRPPGFSQVYTIVADLIIRRKRRMRALYDAGDHPGIDSLLRYSAVQAWRSTQPFEETPQDPRFVLQNVEPAPAPPPVIPEPIIAPIQPIVPPFVRMPFQRQQFNPHFNPYFQHQNNIQQIPQQFNMSLPIYYQQPPPQQFYVQQFPPYFYNPRF
uniref:Uncharacterized protein n=1 Tax=Panagrolaimus davidi TaxID=227884 RepID=A0A914P8Q5_9BILA